MENTNTVKAGFFKSMFAVRSGNIKGYALNHTGWYIGLLIFKGKFYPYQLWTALKGY